MPEPYRDPARPMEARVDDLLARMTLDEKLAQLGCVWSTALVEEDRFSEKRAEALMPHGTGQITRIGGSTGLRPHEVAAFTNEIQDWLRDHTRLGIPALVHEESCAGLLARDATQFPQAIGLASTWDPGLARRMTEVIRGQMLAVGARQALAPVLDVARDPRWGRTEETFGESPYLVSRMGVAYVAGLQGERLETGVVATGKHFLGYGFSEGGLNHAPVHVGPRELREVFARPFAAAIHEAGLASVMNAYNEVDGLPCGGSREILEALLREELGFGGVVVADYFTVRLLEAFHAVAADRGEAAQMALEAGLDVELPSLDGYGEPLRQRIEDGRCDVAPVDRSVRRVLAQKMALGLFERPRADPARVAVAYEAPESVTLAREIATRSLVLLRNEGGLLPLAPGTGRVAVIGPAADDPRLLQGDYSYPAHVEIVYKRPGAGDEDDIAPAPGERAMKAGPYYRPMVTPLAGIRALLGDPARVRHARGCEVTGDDESGLAEAVEAAAACDVAVVCLGGKSGLLPDCTSGEFRDAAGLGLTGVQQALVEAVVASGTPTVVVLVNGRPLALPWIAGHVPAVLEAWLPGEQGGAAIADVLFGRANPAGRLPVTIPRAVGQVPLYHDHKSGGGRSQMLGDYSDLPVSPLFPFGHGLSYSGFAYGALEIAPPVARPDEPVRISLDVTHCSGPAGDEVVQLYVRDPVASVTRPRLQLAGFVRARFEPGQTRRVTFVLDPSQLAFHDRAMRYVVEPGEVEVKVGASSADLRAEGRFRIEGAVREIRFVDAVPTAVEVS